MVALCRFSVIISNVAIIIVVLIILIIIMIMIIIVINVMIRRWPCRRR